MNRDLLDYRLGQIQQSVKSLESDVSDLKDKADELITWLQRLALLAGLWAGAIGLNLDPDKIGATLAQILKSAK